MIQSLKNIHPGTILKIGNLKYMVLIFYSLLSGNEIYVKCLSVQDMEIKDFCFRQEKNQKIEILA